MIDWFSIQLENYSAYNIFNRYKTDIKSKETNEKKSRGLRSQILIFFPSFIFKKNHVLVKEENFSEKIVIVNDN